MFGDDDPYTGIDLDDTHGDPEANRLQEKICREFDSYTEVSPSGTGLHIIVKGNVSCGRRRDGVEVYSSDRFFTMTGNIVNNAPIASRQELLDTLHQEMGGGKEADAGIQADRAVNKSDAEVVALLYRDPVMAARYNGDISHDGKDNSRADQALVNSLAILSGNREQVERIWLASPLGHRVNAANNKDKTQARPYYRRRTIETAFNRPEIKLVDTSNVTVNGAPLRNEVAAAPVPVQMVDEPDVINVAAWARKAPEQRVWTVVDWVASREVTMLYAPGGAGKSLLSQQICTSVAAGALWMGLQTRRAVSLYVTCEDDSSELHRRQSAILESTGIQIADLDGWMGVVSLAGALNAELATFDASGRMAPSPAYQWLGKTIREMGAGLVVLDNVAHFFSGNENVRNQVAAFLNLLTGLAKETGAAIILIGHPNKSGAGFSGSTAWENQVRTRLNLGIPQEADGTIRDRDARYLVRAKSNYGRAGESLTFRWHEGAFIREADIAELERGRIATHSQANFENEAFLRCLAVCAAQKRNVGHVEGVNYAPKIFEGMPEAGGLKKAAFKRAFERLNGAGVILLEQRVWQRDNRAWVKGIRLAASGVAL
ncbi:AAA family ATPase [Sphingomonas sp. LR60]|uniref:AAA family ATPase n=1 Tax=Sphingomonas sp. LR60 TaxID=3050233 RepID=UPI002FE10732